MSIITPFEKVLRTFDFLAGAYQLKPQAGARRGGAARAPATAPCVGALPITPQRSGGGGIASSGGTRRSFAAATSSPAAMSRWGHIRDSVTSTPTAQPHSAVAQLRELLVDGHVRAAGAAAAKEVGNLWGAAAAAARAAKGQKQGRPPVRRAPSAPRP